jgi:hypothetical protein
LARWNKDGYQTAQYDASPIFETSASSELSEVDLSEALFDKPERFHLQARGNGSSWPQLRATVGDMPFVFVASMEELYSSLYHPLP